MIIANDELPKGWLSCSLGDVVDYGKTAKAEPSEIEENAWILELEDIEKETSKLLERRTFAERRSKSTKNRFETGEVLYGKLRPYLNKVIIADRPGYCTTEIIPLKSNVALDGRYLFYWLKHPVFLDYVGGVSHGLNMPRLGTDAGKAAPFVLAPLAEQKRIANKLEAVLGRVNACRDRLDRVPNLLKRFRQSVLTAAASGQLTEEWRDENSAPEWNDVTLEEVAEDFDYGTSAKSSKIGVVPVLRMGNIQEGRLDWDDLVFTSDKEEIAKYRLLPGDVLFNRTNSPELVGKTAVFKGEREAIFAGYLIRVRCSERLLPDYINYCLNSPAGRDYCWQVKTDGVSQSNINAKKLAAFPFQLPSPAEQQEVVRRVEALFAFADRIEPRLAEVRIQVERLTPATLAKAFRGEFVPQDPNDEPATVLLERLLAAKKIQAAQPTREKAPQKRIMKSSTKESVRGVVLSMKKDKFTFPEIREAMQGDYDALREAVFQLLAEDKPILKQVFNTKAKIMQFERSKA